jgi:hypothetical protein
LEVIKLTKAGYDLSLFFRQLNPTLEAVPEEYRKDRENHVVLATLFEGIQMTDDGLSKAFA